VRPRLGQRGLFQGLDILPRTTQQNPHKKAAGRDGPGSLALPHLREGQDAQSRTRRKQCQNLARLALQPIFECGAIVESGQRLVPPESLVKVTIGSGPK
jgi:hypothetical protein